MTHSVTFLLGELDETQWLAIRSCAERFGLEAVRCLAAGGRDVVPGITTFLAKQPAIQNVVYIYSGVELGEPSAFELYDETVMFRDFGRKPRIIPLLQEIGKLTEELGKDRYFLYCTEWPIDSDVFYFQGSINDLVNYIFAVQVLGIWFLSTRTGQLEASDRYPVLFQFTS